MNSIVLDGTWQRVVDGATVFIGEVNVTAQVIPQGLADPAPAVDAVGLTFSADQPQVVPDVDTLGGTIWVKGTGTFKYASDA